MFRLAVLVSYRLQILMARKLVLFGVLLLACVASRPAGAYESDEDDDDSGSDQNVAAVMIEQDFMDETEWTIMKGWPRLDNWESRGKLTYTGPKHINSKSKRLVSVHVEQTEFTAEQVEKLQALIDRGGMYRIRMPSDVNNASSTKIMASIPACMLASSKFHEILRVHVDQFGHIRSLWYTTLATECPPYGTIKLPSGRVKLVTSVSVDMESRGPKLASEPKPKSPEEEVMDKQNKMQNQSFLQKYWMYILGGVVLMSLLGGEDDPKGGGGGGGGARK